MTVFIFTLFCRTSETIHLFQAPKRSVKNKKLVSFPPLLPLGQQWLRLHFVELPTYAIFISLVIEIHINNTDTFRVTDKQFYKMILFKRFLLNKATLSKGYCQILQTFSRKIVPDNTSFSLRCEVILNLY